MQLLACLFLVAVLWGQSEAKEIKECVSNKYPPPADHKVPVFEINLDLPPQQRWLELGKAKRTEIRQILKTFKNSIAAFGEAGKYLIKLVDADFGRIVASLPAPFGDEIKGLATATGLPLGEAALYNVFYEVFTWCTSIVAEDKQGNIFHARNLDFGLMLGWDPNNHTWAITEALRPALVELHFMRGGKVAYKSISFAGYIGVITGVKPGVFSFTINERFNRDGGYLGLIKWIFGNHNATWVSFIGRQVLEDGKSYDEVLKRLTTPELIAPVYFILGGVSSRQGAVITRDRTSTLDVWHMKDAGKWYVLETNYDHWEKPLFIDDRRTPAHKCMLQKGQANMSMPVLFDVLSSRPMLNKLSTYTALMQAKTGHLEAYQQFCQEPCWPW